VQTPKGLRKRKGPHPEGGGGGPYGSRRGKRDDGGEVSMNVIQAQCPQRWLAVLSGGMLVFQRAIL
jgi:hypothetical protein